VASSQYGGQTINRADEILAPYAEKNYAKNMETARAMFPDDEDIDDAKRIVERMKSRERKWLHIEDREPIPDDTPFNDDASEIDKIREVYAKILTRKNIYDAMQTMEYQVNTQHATCGQTPFVTVGFGLGTSWFSREITRCIFYIRIAGLGKDHRTAIFPKLTYTIKHGVNSESTDPNYDMKKLALECTSKRMYPDILFYENIEKITGSFKAPMGCRSFLQGWVNPETGEDEEEGRMNLGVVTVNIPRIAIESRGNIKKFWKLFDQRMAVAHHALQFRIKRCAETVPANAPVLWQNGAFGKLGDNGNVDSLMKNSRSTVSLGYIGLYEATSMFYGREWINDFGWDDDARDFAISILHKMSDLCNTWEEEEGYHYSVYGTPSESLTDRFSRADKEKFGVIPGITDHEFYTNSFHRPVWLSGNDDHTVTDAEKDVISRPRFHHASNGGPFSKLDFEQPFLEYTAGGHIVYTEEPRLVQNLQALEAIWDYAHSIGIDYLGTNTPIDRCYVCNYEGDFAPTDTGYKCPQCGNDDPDRCDTVKRVCGYLGNPQARPMIHGRHEELIHRKKQLAGETGRITDSNGNEQTFYDDKARDI
jgi:ribonucleoside-triphosphate reductase